MYRNITSVETGISIEFWCKNKENSENEVGILTT